MGAMWPWTICPSLSGAGRPKLCLSPRTEGYKEVELIFYAYDSTDCLVSLNGEARLTVSRSSVENIINDISKLITAGEEQPTEE